MSAPVNAGDFAQLCVRAGLMEDQVAKECLYELDDRMALPESLAKIMERKGLITPLQTSRLMKGEVDGYVLGGYRLLYKIASGSFGRVYRGDDPRTGQIVAIKILRKKWTDDKKKIEMFEREGRLGLTLQHPNIVSILAVNKDHVTGQYYIVMQFIEGGNLRDILGIRKKLEVDEALRILEECASGLAYAHSRGLTHRDIKPTNILIATDKTARLVDFGLAEISAANAPVFSDRKPGKDEVLEVDRTVDYAGLERLTGQGKGDVRSDIYFLGTVLFEMLTGVAILPATRDQNVMKDRRRYDLDDVIPTKGYEFGLPKNIIHLIGKMCAFEPASRFQTPAAMLEAVKTVREELSTGGKVEARKAAGPMTVFVVEKNSKLQDAFREKFKTMGLRVLLSIDPDQAHKRYQQQPYHALIMDAGTVGQPGVEAYDNVLRQAETMHLDVTGILILNEDQAGLAKGLKPRHGGNVFIRPVTMKQLAVTLREKMHLDAVHGEHANDDHA